jgi:hypothetical protein
MAKQIMTTLLVLSRKYCLFTFCQACQLFTTSLQRITLLPIDVCFSYSHFFEPSFTYVHRRSGKLAFDENADIDIRGMMLGDFKDCLEEKSLDEDALFSDIGTSDEDSQSSDGKGYMGAGAGLHFDAAGLKSFSGMLGKTWGDDDDDLDAVISEAGDADDAKTSMRLESDAYNASIKSICNGFGKAGAPVTSPPPPPPPGVATAA